MFSLPSQTCNPCIQSSVLLVFSLIYYLVISSLFVKDVKNKIIIYVVIKVFCCERILLQIFFWKWKIRNMYVWNSGYEVSKIWNTLRFSSVQTKATNNHVRDNIECLNPSCNECCISQFPSALLTSFPRDHIHSPFTVSSVSFMPSTDHLHTEQSRSHVIFFATYNAPVSSSGLSLIFIRQGSLML